MSESRPEPPETSLDRARIKVLLLEGIHPGAAGSLEAAGYTNVEVHPGSLPGGELREALADTFILGIRSRTKLHEEVLDAAPKLLAIGCFCIGTNQVDVDSAQARGIPVFNAPFSNTRSVAELVLAEVILLLRGIPQRSALAHRGVWAKSASGAHEARGKCLGIVGYGHIGSQVGLLAESLGMRVLYHDVAMKLALGNATPVRSLDDLLASADVVTLHVPETPATHRMIGADELIRMRRGTALVNASRGTVVDVDALAAALESEHLSGAAIDVFPVEPGSGEEEFVSPLRDFDNVILTPHIGGSTAEAQESIGLEVAEKLVRYSDNGSTVTAVNFPEVSLPEHAGMHRILHIHRNQPGMLSQVNGIFSEREINVAAQYLQTSGEVGYVVIDVDASDGADTPALRRALDRIEGTIRTRLLY